MTTTARMPPTIFSNFLIVLFIAIYSCAAKLSIYFLPTKYSANFFANYLEVSEILYIFAPSKYIIMVQDVGLNQAQMDFLRLLSHFKTEEEVRELNELVCKYYAQKIDEEMDRLWDEGKWNHEKIEETLKEHLRTPYHV